MKKLIIIATIALLAIPQQSYANMQCGIKPIKPISCYNGQAVCMCSNNNVYYSNNCSWVWMGC